MGKRATVALYVLVLVAVVVGVDVLFFRNRVLGAAECERRDRPGVRGVLLAFPEASVNHGGHCPWTIRAELTATTATMPGGEIMQPSERVEPGFVRRHRATDRRTRLVHGLCT
jgi:hypothetical protein